MGLGLNICQTILRHHGDKIIFESAFGEWTVITLFLPSSIEVNNPITGKHSFAEVKDHKSAQTSQP
jgi:signal transduction histidine kinase